MRGDDLETWKTVKCPFEDQVLQSNRGVEWIADCVRQPAIAFEALGGFGRALRMDEQNRAEVFSLGPHRMEFRVGKILAQHTGADGSPPQALLPDSCFELLNCEVGKLQGQGGESAE